MFHRHRSLLVCGGEMSITEHGTIKSPGSPGNYPPNRDCIWKLTAPTSKRIQLHFFTMQLEAHETCQFDYLAVRILILVIFFFFKYNYFV